MLIKNENPNICGTGGYNKPETLCLLGNIQPVNTKLAMLIHCWPTLYNAGPTLNQHWLDVARLLEKLTLVNDKSPASGAAPACGDGYGVGSEKLRQIIGGNSVRDEAK